MGALCGVGIASNASIKWAWKKGSVSQTAASWGIAPAIAGGFAAVIFLTINLLLLDHRDNALQWGLCLIPLYLSLTGANLALFIVVEAPTADSLESFGAGKSVGIILGVFAGCLLVSYVFFVPYFRRRLVQGDKRLRAYHVVLGPLLRKEDLPLFWPGDPNEADVLTYYNSPAPASVEGSPSLEEKFPVESPCMDLPSSQSQLTSHVDTMPTLSEVALPAEKAQDPEQVLCVRKTRPEPEERFLAPTAHLPLYHPRRLWS